MTRGRPVDPGRRLDRCEGSTEAKQRAKAVADYIAGHLCAEEAGDLMGVCPSRVHAIVSATLQAMVEANECKPAGRPPETTERDEEIATLEKTVKTLEQELKIAKILGEQPWAPRQRGAPKRP